MNLRWDLLTWAAASFAVAVLFTLIGVALWFWST